MKELAGKVALVTGATSGIGRATAIALGAAGARVVLTGRRAAEGAEVARLVAAAGTEARFVQGDVAREDDCRAMVAEAVAAFGRLDMAVNNAGFEGALGLRVEDTTVENYRTVMDTNVLGTLLSMKHEIPALRRAGGGTIVNVASVAGLVAFQGDCCYVASKHAIIGLTKAAALEYAPQGVRVNAVAPGAVQTAMIERVVGGNPGPARAAHPLGRFGTPEEIAAAILWLAGPASSFVTGAVLTADGGYTVH